MGVFKLRKFFLLRNVEIGSGKARRLKQAKEEAQAEVEAYRQERERLYKDHENKVLVIFSFCSIATIIYLIQVICYCFTNVRIDQSKNCCDD